MNAGQDNISNESGLSESEMRQLTSAGFESSHGVGATARAAMVNRTHRVVRERAKTMQARKKQVRSLWVPMAICSALVIILATAIWTVLDDFGMPDESHVMLLLWFLPLSAAILAMVWYRRSREQSGEDQRP